ncbi:Nitroreductase [Alteribacillus persepolensis]|uniref:Putative NAD(P)H nitroreductase n=1 Tax=Alteribacillus persepolensis TaxID=568899 RepID=A0A1G7YCU5_9BACI|nr:nitroreductase [Alteribacillus persepolensis]SDG94163.1 Nitroreductase [Alteribacillus persepolensis]
MELSEGLLSRRTIHKFTNEPVDKSVIEKAVHCAVHAPNHKMTEPWRFYAMTGETKEKLAKRRSELKVEKFLDKNSERAKQAKEDAYQFMIDLPWVIAVTTHRYSVDPVREKEDYAAVACAIQNFMLAAWEEGVGTKWATGQLVNDSIAREIVQPKEEEDIIGFLFLGYPKEVPKRIERHETESVSWLE